MGEKIVTKEQRGPSFVRKIMYHKEMEKERFGIVRQPKEAVVGKLIERYFSYVMY